MEKKKKNSPKQQRSFIHKAMAKGTGSEINEKGEGCQGIRLTSKKSKKTIGSSIHRSMLFFRKGAEPANQPIL